MLHALRWDFAMSLKGRTHPGASFAQSVWALLRKDLLLEWRSKTRLNATLAFAGLSLLLFSFAAGPRQALLAQQAPGYLWLGVFLASVLAVGESMRIEAAADALMGALLLGTPANAIYLAKVLVNTAFLLGLAVMLWPMAVVLYGMGLGDKAAWLFAIMPLGALAIAVPGTLFATMAAQVRAQDVLLPLLMFPVLVPGLLASVKATSLVVAGDPMNQLGSWIVVLMLFDAVYLAVCFLLFPRVVDDGS